MYQKKNDYESTGKLAVWVFRILFLLLFVLVTCVAFTIGDSQTTNVFVNTSGGVCEVGSPGGHFVLDCGLNTSRVFAVTHNYNVTNVTHTVVENLDYEAIRDRINVSVSCPNTSSLVFDMGNLTPLLLDNNKGLKDNISRFMGDYFNAKLMPKQAELDSLVEDRDEVVEEMSGLLISLNESRRDLGVANFKLDSCEEDKSTYTWLAFIGLALVASFIGFIVYQNRKGGING